MAKDQDFEKDFVRLKNVSKIYRMGEVEIRAVDKIEFAIDKGEFVVVVGPSGAGKTTVLNILGGMDTVTSGDVLVDGENIAKYSQRKLTGYRRDDIGFVFQFYNLVPNRTAKENVELALQICKEPLVAVQVLKEVGLGNRLDNFPAQLSGGEQQRVSIARALAKNPKLLLWERRNNSSTVTDTDENNLKMYLEENYELTSESVIKAGVDIVSNENKYHPIRDYLESLVWDGIPRIENMLPHFLGAEKSKYTIGVMKMHMLAAISRIYEPGIKYDIMLCLVGSQGAGKSTFFKYLAIKEEWFSDNLDHLDDENIYRKLQNHWIIEMGEMKATITAKNIEQIKSFLSRQKETYKVPYEVHPEDRPRQCVFCGTSNDLNFLPLDRTGNRRFAPVMTDMSKAEVHILDNEAESKAYIEQAWAEAMVLYRQGNVFLGFTKEIEEEAKRLQKEFMPEDTNAGIIQAFLDDYDDEYVCTRILFDEALHRTGEMKQWEGKEIANIMNNAIEGWKPHGTHRFGKEYGIQRSWKRMEDSVKKDKDGFMEVPEQLEIPFE